jgi:hypothetical protein
MRSSAVGARHPAVAAAADTEIERLAAAQRQFDVAGRHGAAFAVAKAFVAWKLIAAGIAP